MQAFKKLRVLEIAEGIPGPVAGLQFADLGAEVIKIEPPDGDRAREWGPPMLGDDAAIFVHLNRGKRSVTLDGATPRGRAQLNALLASADVAILHMDPPDRAALGLDWSEVLARHPRLVACEIDDFGPVGPFAGQSGSEMTVQALSGYTRYLGTPRGPKMRVGMEIAGMAAGMHAFQACTAALFHLHESGNGQLVRISALKAVLSLKSILFNAQDNSDEWNGFHMNGPWWPQDMGLPTQDGQITMDFRDRRDAWEEFVRRIGQERLLTDPDYADWRNTFSIGDNWPKFSGPYAAWSRTQTSEAASAVINGLDGISVKFQDYKELLANPQVRENDSMVAVEDPRAPEQLGTPFHFAGEPTFAATAPAPRLGQDNDALLGGRP